MVEWFPVLHILHKSFTAFIDELHPFKWLRIHFVFHVFVMFFRVVIKSFTCHNSTLGVRLRKWSCRFSVFYDWQLGIFFHSWKWVSPETLFFSRFALALVPIHPFPSRDVLWVFWISNCSRLSVNFWYSNWRLQSYVLYGVVFLTPFFESINLILIRFWELLNKLDPSKRKLGLPWVVILSIWKTSFDLILVFLGLAWLLQLLRH